MGTEENGDNMTEENWSYRPFVIRGRVYSGNESHAAHVAYWAMANSESDDSLLIDHIEIETNETEK